MQVYMLIKEILWNDENSLTNKRIENGFNKWKLNIFLYLKSNNPEILTKKKI
jgi:hypothetical protein